MLDRDELLRIRIDHRLDDLYIPTKKVKTGMGTMAVRQFSENGITIGAFAKTKRLVIQSDPHYFIESSVPGSAYKRQLWLPADRWEDIDGHPTFVPHREIIETTETTSRRFAAWQDVQPYVYDLNDYSPTDPINQALYEQASLLLQFIDANDDSFSIEPL